MSGCQEGILVDLSESVESSPIKVTDSIELLRDDPLGSPDHLPTFGSPFKGGDSLLLDISTKSNTPGQSSPLRLIDAEIFDFDLPLTPATNSDKSSTSTPGDEEEEVFFGPMGFRERCVSTIVNSVTKEPKPLSPLNPRQIAEICKEANAVACRISSAASGRNSKNIPKQNLFCAKKLALDHTVFSMEAVGSLLKAVRKTKTSEETDDDDKENCDNQPMDVDMSDGSTRALEAFLSNEIPVTESKSNSESESCESPAKRHNRSGTYTLDKTSHDKLPVNKRESLPVVASSKSLAVKDKGEGVKGRRSISKLQQPASKLSKPTISGMNGPKSISKPDITETTGTNLVAKPQMKSRLSMPKAGSLLPSKLKPMGTNSSTNTTSRIPSKPAQQMPQKSALPGPKGRVAPMSKLQLMKPSGLQRPGSLQAKNPDSTKKGGPLKAFVPTKKQEFEKEKAPATITPSKVEKRVQPKNLSSSFSTPSRNGSTSSLDSPASSMKTRRSYLPGPNKPRLGSNGSIPSPCLSRTSSTSSQRSVDSPLVSSRRPSLGNHSVTKVFDGFDDSSPSAMRSQKPLVTNTPNMPRKKISQWSPLQKKKPLDLVDQVIMCTKKQRR